MAQLLRTQFRTWKIEVVWAGPRAYPGTRSHLIHSSPSKDDKICPCHFKPFGRTQGKFRKKSRPLLGCFVLLMGLCG